MQQGPINSCFLSNGKTGVTDKSIFPRITKLAYYAEGFWKENTENSFYFAKLKKAFERTPSTVCMQASQCCEQGAADGMGQYALVKQRSAFARPASCLQKKKEKHLKDIYRTESTNTLGHCNLMCGE